MARLIVVCGVLLIAPGCAGMRGLAFKGNDPFRNRPCTLPKNPTVDQVVAHVNTNVDKVHGWRANSVKIRANNVPLSGSLCVERDQRLRLEVRSLRGKEVDFGSNDEKFWMWAKENHAPGQPPAVYYASHDDMHLARQKLPMPFEPSWMMEALGVKPLSDSDVTMEGEPGVAAIRLVSQHQMPDGLPVKKVIVVNACHGYVMEYSTFDGQGQPLIRALVQDYRPDPATGALVPHYLKLDWPQAEMSLAMDLGHVEVNPPGIPQAVWEMPQVPGAGLVNLGDERFFPGQMAQRPGPTRGPAMSPAGAASTSSSPIVEPVASAKPSVSRAALVDPRQLTKAVASADEELHKDFLPPLTPASGTQSGPNDPANVELESPEFLAPVMPDPPGRVRLDDLPVTDPF